MFASFFTQGNQCPPRQSWEGESTKTKPSPPKIINSPIKLIHLLLCVMGKQFIFLQLQDAPFLLGLCCMNNDAQCPRGVLPTPCSERVQMTPECDTSQSQALSEPPWQKSPKERNYHFFNIFHFKLQGAFFRREAPWTLTSLRSRWVSWGYAACEIQSLSLSPGWRSQNTHSLDTGG